MVLANTRPLLTASFARFTMIPWTTQEISLLTGLGPNAQRATLVRLNRSRASVCGKTMWLRRRDLLPAGVEKHLEVKPVQAQPGCTTTIVAAGMRRCSLLELITANAAGRSATYTRPRRSFAAMPRCQGFPTSIIPAEARHRRLPSIRSRSTSVSRDSSKIAAGSRPVG